MFSQIKKIIYNLIFELQNRAIEFKEKEIMMQHGLHDSILLRGCSLIGNIFIGEHTYANNGTVFSSGDSSKVIVGKYCAIGRYVHITSKGHSMKFPTADKDRDVHEHIESDTIVGRYVWVGDHVFIKHGVSVGDYAIIGANSVVTSDVKAFEIVGGVPARHIRFNVDHNIYTSDK